MSRDVDSGWGSLGGSACGNTAQLIERWSMALSHSIYPLHTFSEYGINGDDHRRTVTRDCSPEHLLLMLPQIPCLHVCSNWLLQANLYSFSVSAGTSYVTDLC